jgi:RNA polymerase sigma factor (sigma-70 family)
MADDELLLLHRYAAGGDADAFAEIVRRHAGMVYGVCARITRNAQDAEDLAQDCFLQLALRARSVTSSLAGWLQVTATRRALNAVRDRQAARRRQESAAEPATAEGGADPRWADIAPHVDRALASLPDDLRTPLVLHFLEGQPHARIAEGLGVDRSTVTRAIERGLGLLRGRLRETGVVGVGASVVALSTLLGMNGASAAPAALALALNKMALSGVGAGNAGTAPVLSSVKAFFASKAAIAVSGIATLAAGGALVLVLGTAPPAPQRVPSPAPGIPVNTDAPSPPSRGLALKYDVPFEGNVSLGVFDKKGALLRWLVRDERRRAGENAELWDGLDQYGKPVAAGDYDWRALVHPPVTLKHAMTVGNPGTPPWPTPDDRGDWIGDESSPQGAATDGAWVYLASPCSEKGFALIGVDEAGQRQWGTPSGLHPRCVSLAVGGDFLYALYSGPEGTDRSMNFNGKNAVERALLVCLDKRTGKPARFTRNAPALRVHSWPYREDVHFLWDLRARSAFAPDVYGGQPRYFCADVGETTGALGIAATPSRLYVSLFYEDRLLVLDAETAKPVDEIPLPKPAGLHALDGETLLAVSAGTVVKVDARSKRVTPLVTQGLAAPFNVTADRNGRVYVADWGASFQVKVFSADGRPLRAIGKAGGRPWVGAWEPGGMILPRGLAVTRAGALWVAEDDSSPCRVSVWNAETGARVRDYLGPATYGGGPPFWRDPRDPSTLLAEGVLWRVDEARRSAVPLSTPFRRMSRNQPFVVNSGVGPPLSRTVVHDTHQLVVLGGGGAAVTFYRREGGILRPAAALGALNCFDAGDGTFFFVWDSDIGKHLYRSWFPDFFKGHTGDNFSWTDLNGDGQVDPDEMRWAPTAKRVAPYEKGRLAEWSTPWGAGVDRDGAVFFAGATRDRQALYRLEPRGWTKDGAPIFDINDARELWLTDKPGGIHGVTATDEGRLLVSYGYESYNPVLPDSLACLDRDGTYLWGVARPRLQGAKDILSDTVLGDVQVPGLGRIFCTWLWHANYRPYLVTSDGLYVTSLLEDSRLGPTACWDESFKYLYQGPDGVPVLVNGANDAYHLLKIEGLDKSRRFNGVITLSPDDVKSAEAIRKALSETPQIPRPILKADWPEPAPVIDGDLGDWNMAAGARFEGGAGRAARVALKKDAESLYLAYEVSGATLVNKGTDWRTLFVTGDCVDLMLASGRNARTPHYAASEGDLRLLMGVCEDKPVAVLYRPVVPGTQTPTRLMAARIDQIVRLPSARVAFKRSGASYTLEAAVPLRDLEIDPKETGVLKGDVGVIFADETGKNRSLRLYYYNRETRITADLTTEATLQPGEWGDLLLPLGRNLLRDGGFESPLAPSPDRGWAVGESKNGARAALVDGASHSGSAALLLQQSAEVVYPAEAFQLPTFDAFLKSANGGQGGGYASVSQKVKVSGGKTYAFRMHYRELDSSGGERQGPGPGRGYTSLSTWIYWQGAPGAVWVTNAQHDKTGWESLLNVRVNHWAVNVPYTAPPGATGAVVSFQLVCNAGGHTPRVFIDDVELVDVEP